MGNSVSTATMNQIETLAFQSLYTSLLYATFDGTLKCALNQSVTFINEGNIQCIASTGSLSQIEQSTCNVSQTILSSLVGGSCSSLFAGTTGNYTVDLIMSSNMTYQTSTITLGSYLSTVIVPAAVKSWAGNSSNSSLLAGTGGITYTEGVPLQGPACINTQYLQLAAITAGIVNQTVSTLNSDANFKSQTPNAVCTTTGASLQLKSDGMQCVVDTPTYPACPSIPAYPTCPPIPTEPPGISCSVM